MREALSALTLRGRAFLAAGVTAVACAVVLGQPMLTRVGLLLAVGPLLTAAMGMIFVLALGVSQRRNLLTSVHGVERDSYGELLLPLAIAVSAIIAPTPAVFVATMLVYGVRRLLTHNTADFAPFADLITVVPLVAPPPAGDQAG